MKRVLLLLIALAVPVAVPTNAAAATETGELGVSLPPSTFVGALTAGPDGNVWFSAANYGGDGVRVVGKVTPGGTVTEYNAPAGADSLTTGPDGNVWFTEADGIGRITPGGEVSSFELAGGSGTPRALTTGPDGNVWFVTAEPAAVGRITTSGAMRTFPLPTGAGSPSAITAGPSGDLWFTEPKAARIGRITTSGKLSEFPLPNGSGAPNSIALGDDGDLWFSDSSNTRLGRITPAGDFTFFPVPTIEATDEVIAGPGGLIWFAAGNEIGTINTAGKVGWPSCFTGGCEYPPAAMTTGPEGDLWVASGVGHCPGYCGGGSEQSYVFGASSIGRFALSPVPFGIGPRVAPIQRGRTSIVIGCGDATPCRGTLRLRALVRLPHKANSTRTISRLPYSLAPGQIEEIPLHLPAGRWNKLRYGRGFLIVDAIEGGKQVAKRGFYFTPEKGGIAKHW